MKRARVMWALASAFLFCCAALFSGAQAQQSIDEKQDIAQLLAQANQRFDLTKEDAVILLDAQKVLWLADGRMAKFVHRIIWIGTQVARNRYGDNRIPYDAAHCAFNVTTVRTWRDGQWWETGATGKVETLPFAVNAAYDYTNVREMMLLHNGIELPCILEVAFSVEDKQPFRQGVDGLWLFQRDDPVVKSWFGLGLPKGQKPNVFVSEGVPSAEIESDDKLGIDVHWWKAGPMVALGLPHTSDPAAYTPHVEWSTWKDWRDYGRYPAAGFQLTTQADESLKMGLDSLLQRARNDAEKAKLIAEFVNSRTRFVSYPEEYWWTSPRPATRTFETGYGHRLDRAILAAAMFNQAGLKTFPMFISQGYGNTNTGIPTLSRMGGVGVWVTGDNLQAYYDPSAGSVSDASARAWGRTVWRPGYDESNPEILFPGEGDSSRADIRIDLAYDGDKAKFVGTGYFFADNALSPYGRMVGVGNEAKTHLGRVVSSVLKDAGVTSFNPSRFESRAVAAGFEIEIKKPEGDDSGRVTLVVGEPSGTILDRLPDDVRLYQKERTSPVCLPGRMEQKVTLQLNLEGLKVLYRPADRMVDNAAGHSAVTAVVRDSTLVVTRELELKKATYQPSEWPLLRALFLAEKHERSQTLILSTPAGGKEGEGKKEPAKE